MPFTELNRSNKEKKKGQKIEGESKKKKEVPIEFIKKIEKLGMRIEDADALYASKIEWTAIYSENKIYCTDRGCDFYTQIDSDILTNHMKDSHNYGEHPCSHAHCNFVAYSKVSFYCLGDDYSQFEFHVSIN